MFKKILISSLIILPNFAFADHGLEPLMGHFSTQGGVHIQVRSGGCTYKKQFEVKTEIKGNIRQLSFFRTAEDLCRAYLPYGEILSFSFEELGLKGGEQYQILNPESVSRVSRN